MLIIDALCRKRTLSMANTSSKNKNFPQDKLVQATNTVPGMNPDALVTQAQLKLFTDQKA